jgi:hypothetical protein
MDSGLILPPIEIREHDGILVVRDDLIEGGTKVRVAPDLLDGCDEWVFAGPAQGYAQLALAIACEARGKRGTFFTAARKDPHPLTKAAMAHGLKVVFVPIGRLSNVRAKARAYCEMTGAVLADMGLLLPGMEDALCELARGLELQPEQVWVTAGSGTLSRALARAWPAAEINSVVVGMRPHLPERAIRWDAPEAFHEPARGPQPPFPSAEAYDRKAWRFVAENAQPGALFWNVGA